MSGESPYTTVLVYKDPTHADLNDVRKDMAKEHGLGVPPEYKQASFDWMLRQLIAIYREKHPKK